MKSFIKTITKHFFIYGSGNVAGKLVGFLLLPIYTRYLSPLDYGILELLSVSMSIAAFVILQGLPSAFFRSFCLEYKDDSRHQKIVLSTSYLYMLITSAVLFAVLFSLSSPINDILFKHKDYGDLIRLVCITGFFSVNVYIPQALMRARLESMKYSLINLIKIILNILLNIFFVVVLGKGLAGIIYGNLISSASVFCIMTFLMLKEVSFTFSRAKLVSMLSFGLPLVPGALSLLVMTSSDRYFLQLYSTTHELGLYSLGYKISSILQVLLITPFFLVWPSMYLPLAAEDDGRDKIAKFASYFVLAIFSIGMVLLVFSKPLIHIMAASKFWDCYIVCPFIVSSIILYGLSGVFNVGINIKKKTKYIPLIAGVSAGINLLLNGILIPSHGMIGAALSTLLSYCVYCFMSLVVSQKSYFIPFEWRRILIIVLSYGSIVVLSYFFTPNEVISALATGAAFTTAFFFLVIVLCFFRENDFNTAKLYVKKLLQSPFKMLQDKVAKGS